MYATNLWDLKTGSTVIDMRRVADHRPLAQRPALRDRQPDSVTKAMDETPRNAVLNSV